MKPRELNEMLLKAFPEIEDRFKEETSWQDGLDTGSTVVFEDVFMHFAFDAAVSGDNDFIDRAGEFLKLCMSLNDSYVTNTILVAVLENIESHIYDPGCMDMMKRIIRKMSLMKARCIGKDLAGIKYGKIYDVISVEDGWYRVFSELDETNIFSPSLFEVVGE